MLRHFFVHPSRCDWIPYPVLSAACRIALMSLRGGNTTLQIARLFAKSASCCKTMIGGGGGRGTGLNYSCTATVQWLVVESCLPELWGGKYSPNHAGSSTVQPLIIQTGLKQVWQHGIGQWIEHAYRPIHRTTLPGSSTHVFLIDILCQTCY